MAERITNADMERMLREMSPAARMFARQMTANLTIACHSRYALYALWNAGRNYERALNAGMTDREQARADALDDAFVTLLANRCEIVDRWGA